MTLGSATTAICSTGMPRTVASALGIACWVARAFEASDESAEPSLMTVTVISAVLETTVADRLERGRLRAEATLDTSTVGGVSSVLDVVLRRCEAVKTVFCTSRRRPDGESVCVTVQPSGVEDGPHRSAQRASATVFIATPSGKVISISVTCLMTTLTVDDVSEVAPSPSAAVERAVTRLDVLWPDRLLRLRATIEAVANASGGWGIGGSGGNGEGGGGRGEGVDGGDGDGGGGHEGEGASGGAGEDGGTAGGN